jgi:hypothetical protein
MDASAPLPSLADQAPTWGLSIEPCAQLKADRLAEKT